MWRISPTWEFLKQNNCNPSLCASDEVIILYERYKIICNPCLSLEYYIQRTGKDGEVMKELAIRYCKEGYGCGGCIIKAADTKYSLNMNGELIKAMSAASGGFGYGGLCAAVAAAVL